MNPEDHPARKGADHPHPNNYPIIILRRCFDGWESIRDKLDSDGDIILECKSRVDHYDAVTIKNFLYKVVAEHAQMLAVLSVSKHEDFCPYITTCAGALPDLDEHPDAENCPCNDWGAPCWYYSNIYQPLLASTRTPVPASNIQCKSTSCHLYGYNPTGNPDDWKRLWSCITCTRNTSLKKDNYYSDKGRPAIVQLGMKRYPVHVACPAPNVPPSPGALGDKRPAGRENGGSGKAGAGMHPPKKKSDV